MIGETPRIGISSCLLGEEVRYDGGHKHSRYVTDTLGRHFDFVPWCPEVGIGLGTPRRPIRLVEVKDGTRVRDIEDPGIDVTDRLVEFGRKVAGRSAELSGYILKKDSPSCGMERVRVYADRDGPPERKGVGAFAGELMARLPNLPVEEEGRLMDPGLRENFIERVFTYHRWQRLVQDGLTAEGLIRFHTQHKFFVLAHSEPIYRELGRLVANAGVDDLESLAARYIGLLMRGLKRHATPAKNANVLMHIMGYFKDRLDSADKEELLALIDAHRRGLVPVIVPITLINHYLRRFPNEYIAGQVYLEPHPRELMLRAHI